MKKTCTILAVLILLTALVYAPASWAGTVADTLGSKSQAGSRLQIKSAAFVGYSSTPAIASGNGSSQHLATVPLNKGVDAFFDFSSEHLDGFTKKNRPLDTRSVVGFHFCID